MYKRPHQRIVESVAPDNQTKEIVRAHDAAINDLVAAVRNLQEYAEEKYGYDQRLVDDLRKTFTGLLARIHELEARAARDDTIYLALAALAKNVNFLYQREGLKPPAPLNDIPQNYQVNEQALQAGAQNVRADRQTEKTDRQTTDDHQVVIAIKYLKQNNPNMSLRQIVAALEDQGMKAGKDKVAVIIRRLEQGGSL